MARRPSVFVRPLSMVKGRKLQWITRTAKIPVRVRRAIMMMMSGQGRTVDGITAAWTPSPTADVISSRNQRSGPVDGS